MIGMKIKKIILLLILCAICLVVTDLHATEIKKDCLVVFSTEPESKHPLSNEKSRIVYYYQPDWYGNESDIFSIRPDGTDIIQHTNSDDGLPYKYNPEYSPDGKMLAFSAYSTASFETVGYDIIVANVTTDIEYPDNIIRRLDSGCHDSYPSFSPDNEKLLAVRECSSASSTEIIIFNINDGTWSSLGNFELTDIRFPKFSPDSTKIVFYAYDNEWPLYYTWDIYIINSDGTGLTNLTDSPNDSEYDPNWSPDGQYLVYSNNPGGNGNNLSELHIMYSDGTYIQPLTGFNSTAFHYSSFSPDGKKLVYDLHYFDGQDDIYNGMYIMNIYEDYLAELKEPVVYEGAPFWSLKFESPRITLMAYPRYIAPGASTKLLWKTSDAYSCKIENDVGNDIGTVDVNGTIQVTPSATTVYTLKAYGLAGSVTSVKMKIIVE